MAAIPLSWNDPIFSGVTSSGSVTLRDGETISNQSITDSGDLASVVGYGSFTVDGVRINSTEGVRIGGSGDIVINNSYIETKGGSGDHADGIQAYDPGGTGNVTISNTTIASNNDNATAGMFIADDYNGTFTFNNVVFQGGPFGLRIAADDKDMSVALKDVYFVGPFEHDPIFFEKVNADIHITQWDNVRYATIENGELVPGAPISAPFSVEGGSAEPTPAPSPAPAPTPTPDTTIEAPQMILPTASIDFTNLREGWDDAAIVRGTADSYAQIKLSDGTESLGSVNAGSDGSWTFRTSALSDTVHTFSAQQIDSTGLVVATSSDKAILGSTGSDTRLYSPRISAMTPSKTSRRPIQPDGNTIPSSSAKTCSTILRICFLTRAKLVRTLSFPVGTTR
jgi:hypothetical protein